MATAALDLNQPREIKAPSVVLALTELPRALMELGALAWSAGALLATAPHGDGHPVLVLPGFMTSDASTRVLRRFLRTLGYDAHAWNLGRNLGRARLGEEGEKLIERLRQVHELTGQKVSIVGWSLGGIMGRLLARRAPDAVRQVITLGSPFAGSPRATNVWKLYEMMSGKRIDDAHTKGMMAEISARPSVPCTAIFSKADGIVAWQTCREEECEMAENIEVRGSHCGLGVNPSVLYAVADRLARKPGDRRRFDRSGWRGLVYPAAAGA